jgi:monofunctional biosynthetic peptidoglycan transglycosylase
MLLDLKQIEWRVINDGVMGGRSRSSVRVDDRGLHFHGKLSTANAGGFASVRGQLKESITGFASCRLTVSGDGRRYQLRLREDEDDRNVAWRASFQADSAARTLTLQASEFAPVFRGRQLEVLPGIEDRRLQVIGFMLASEDEGDFNLTVSDIELIPAEAPDA